MAPLPVNDTQSAAPDAWPDDMYHHIAYGLTIRSNRSLHELPSCPPTAAVDIEIVWEDAAGAHTADRDWFRSWDHAPGRPQLRAARAESGGYVLRVGDGVEYEIASDARLVRCSPAPSNSRTASVGVLLDQVVPLMLSRRGLSVFHGSAVEVDGRAVAFVGASGRGKSTLASHFGQRGHPVVSDDCLVLDDDGAVVRVRPSYPGVRLWGDSLDALVPAHERDDIARLSSGKWRYGNSGAVPFAASASPLDRVLLLAEATTTSLEISPLHGAALLQAIIGCQFLLDHTDPTELDRSFAAAGGLVGTVPCSRLAVPRDLTRLDEYVEEILALVRA